MTALEIDETRVPGTHHLVDLQDSMHTKHASNHRDIVLIPTPSSDPDDPLNWKPSRKYISTFCYVVYTFCVGYASAAIYSVLVPMTYETGLSLADLNTGTGYMFLTFGWGCLIWQPMALQYGKRPAFLLSLLLTMAILLWAPYTTSNGQWIANKCLQGFVGAPIESLVEIMVTDIWFTHQRGFYMSLYALALGGSSEFAPLVSGFISEGQNWKWVLYWCSIFCGAGFLICFFLMEETNYVRGTFGVVETTDSVTANVSNSSDIEKREKVKTPVTTEVQTGITYSKKSFWSKLSLIDKPKPNRLLRMAQRPLIFLSFPIVIWCGFAYGCSVVIFTVLNGTTSLILSSPPYNFSASAVGASYVAPLLGIGLGATIAGPLGDWWVILRTRRNNGIFEPEMRLWLYGLLTIICPAALLLWGLGAANEIHWFGLVFATGWLSMMMSMTLTLTVSYCADTYKELIDEMMVSIILIRNTMSFGVSYGITPWIVNLGVQNCFISAACLAFGATSVFWIFIIWGKKVREQSKSRYWRYVREKREVLGGI